MGWFDRDSLLASRLSEHERILISMQEQFVKSLDHLISLEKRVKELEDEHT